MSVNVVTTESAAFVLDATVVVIPVYPRGSRVRWLRFSATMYVFCGSCHPLHCSYTMCQRLWCGCGVALLGVLCGNLLPLPQHYQGCPNIPSCCSLFHSLLFPLEHPTVQNFFHNILLFTVNKFRRWGWSLTSSDDGVWRSRS